MRAQRQAARGKVRRGSEGFSIGQIVTCSGSDIDVQCQVGVMTQDLGVIGGFEAVIELHQHVSHGGCGLVGEHRQFDLQRDGLNRPGIPGDSIS